MKRKTLAIAGLVVVLGGGFAAVQAFGGGGGTPPAITTVGNATLVASVSATGNLVPVQQFTLDFANPGRLVEVSVKPGDKVTRGQVLAKIDDRAAQDEVAKTTAAMADANAQLSRDGLVSASLTADRLAVAVATADLHAAQRSLADTALVAPADALVASVANRPGELVGASAPAAKTTDTPVASGGGFISLSDVSALPLRVAFGEADSARIKVGQSAQVTFDALAGRTVEGTVSTVLTTPTVVNNVVTYPVTVTFPLFDGVRPG
ncbi:MAG: HlyD family efflux transporter periplasmic adaptor subunit, partial [Actinomycetota bacterium]|nr:HlyD family efflux transporter periplasmic adaptor subunit [Actinomycetota bacterium]